MRPGNAFVPAETAPTASPRALGTATCTLPWPDLMFFLGLRDCVSLSLRWELSARVDLLCPSLAAFLSM